MLLGRSWGALGALFCALGVVLGCVWLVLGPSGADFRMIFTFILVRFDFIFGALSGGARDVEIDDSIAL